MILGDVRTDDRWNVLGLDGDVHHWIWICVCVVFLRPGAWLLSFYYLSNGSLWFTQIESLCELFFIRGHFIAWAMNPF